MFKAIRARFTFGNVVSVLALFVALGGTAAAAVVITGKNVKNGSLTGADIKNGSVGSVDIKDHDLLAKDFKAGQLPAGPQGAQGPQGAPGLKGDLGAKGDTGAKGDPGPGATRLNFDVATDTPKTKIASIDGLTLYVTCKTSAPEVRLSADFPAGVDISFSYIKQLNTPVNNWVSTKGGVAQTDHTVFDESDASDAYGSGQLIYDNGTNEVSLTFAYTAVSYDCRFHGQAVPAG